MTAVSGRPPSRPWSASGSVAVTAPSTGSGAERLAPGQVQVDRAGADLAARPRQRPAGDRAHVEEARVVGLVGADFAEPAHRFAEGLDLVDRLAGADAAQLRRPVGAEDDQRQRRFVGLGDRGVVVRERRPRGAEQRHRLARSPARRRGRRRQPSARRRSPSPRSPAPAKAPPRAGVDRDPGETTARVSPPRANSSAKAEARAVLALVGSMGCGCERLVVV